MAVAAQLISLPAPTMNGRSRTQRSYGRRHLPLPTGPHTVGCTDILTAEPSDVLVRIFYPADPDKLPQDPHRHWPLWLPKGKYLHGYAIYLKVWMPIAKVANKINGKIYIPAVWNAAPLASKSPVVVFSHGLSACRLTYSTPCLELASHGYVVVALEHKDESACATFRMQGDKKDWIVLKRVPKKNQSQFRREQLSVRVIECGHAMELVKQLTSGQQVTNLLDSESQLDFTDFADVTRAAVAGHSFGGATAILALSTIEYFSVGLALDPWMVPFESDEAALRQIAKPLLCVNMEAFWTEESRSVLKGILEAPEGTARQLFTLKGTVHLNQSDLPFCCMGPLSRVVCRSYSTMDRFRAMDITTGLMLRFLRLYGLASDSDDKTEKREDYLEAHHKKILDTFTHEAVSFKANL